jgi:hypothetical protein
MPEVYQKAHEAGGAVVKSRLSIDVKEVKRIWD